MNEYMVFVDGKEFETIRAISFYHLVKIMKNNHRLGIYTHVNITGISLLAKAKYVEVV